MSAATSGASTAQVENETPRYIPIIDKGPPRPAPTLPFSCEEYNHNIKIHYIRDHEKANEELAKLPHDTQVLGFDCEWKPTYVRGAGENPVALVQLASDETIYLLQVSAMQEFPSTLTQILANPRIAKTGVAIQGDAKKLFNDHKVSMRNCVDLSLLARTVDNARWAGKYSSPLGLARLIETYEYRLLGKGNTTRSNWEAHLDKRQIDYASNDAYAGYALYSKLMFMKAALPTAPQDIWYTFNLISGQLQDEMGRRWQPTNPNYDPGPPPPPRPPREPRMDDDVIPGPSQSVKSPRIGNRAGDENGLKRRLFEDHVVHVPAPQRVNNNQNPRHANSNLVNQRNTNFSQSLVRDRAPHPSFELPYSATSGYRGRGRGSTSNQRFNNGQYRAPRDNTRELRQPHGSSYNNRPHESQGAPSRGSRQASSGYYQDYNFEPPMAEFADDGRGRGRGRKNKDAEDSTSYSAGHSIPAPVTSDSPKL